MQFKFISRKTKTSIAKQTCNRERGERQSKTNLTLTSGSVDHVYSMRTLSEKNVI